MESTRDRFRFILSNFKSNIQSVRLEESCICSLEDLQEELLRIQDEQDALRVTKDFTRLLPFLDSIDQFGHVLRTILGEAEALEVLSYIWGPMKYLLNTTHRTADAFELLLVAYLDFGVTVPPFGSYAPLLASHPPTQKLLADFLEDTMSFHTSVLTFCVGKSWTKLFKSFWKDFNTFFNQSILANLKLQSHALLNFQDSRTVDIDLASYQNNRHYAIGNFQEETSRRKQQEKATVLRWISASQNTITNHQKLVRTRSKQGNSGRWIFGYKDVENWMIRNQSTDVNAFPPHLISWINGEIGLGKTALASLIVEECQAREGFHTGYFYCQSSDPTRNSQLSILKGLIHQVVEKYDNLLPFFYDQMIAIGHCTLNSEEHARALLELIFDVIPRHYIIIDGLNQCSPFEARLTLGFFTDVARKHEAISPGKLRILFLGTMNGELRKQLHVIGNIVDLNPDDNVEDTGDYTSRQLVKLATRFNLGQPDIDLINSSICQQAHGNFLHAKLLIANLKLQAHRKEVMTEVQGGALSPTIDNAFLKLIAKAKQNLDRRSIVMWPKAQDLLGWLTCAKRPLSLYELQAIVSLEPTQGSMDLQPHTFAARVTGLCGPLVHVFEREGVELIHHSAQSHIVNHPDFNETLMQLRMCILCLRYLTLPCFRGIVADEEFTSYVRAGYFSFLEYAAAYWERHLQTVMKKCSSLICQNASLAMDFGAAIMDFVNIHSLTADLGTSNKLEMEKIRRDCRPFTAYPFHASLELALGHIQVHSRSSTTTPASDKVSIPRLAQVLASSRQILESLGPDHPTSNIIPPMTTIMGTAAASSMASTTTTTTTTTAAAVTNPNLAGPGSTSTSNSAVTIPTSPSVASPPLRDFYGTHLFKCSRPHCDLFSQGFASDVERRAHENRHERPFPCPVAACTHGPFGFQSAKDRDRHLRQYHVEESDQPSPFVQPSRRLESARFPCSMCDRSFTRKINLAGHVRSHLGEKPFPCGVCGRAFTRANDCKRHEKIHQR